MKTSRIYLFLFSVLVSACHTSTQDPIPPRKMQVLFLGHDSEHHNSAAYMPLLAAALADDGFLFTYSSDPRSLNPDHLQHYDAVMLYANHDEISRTQEEALLSYVREGGAFVPVHSASYCFRNSKDFVKMVGGQFSSHDTATFQAEIVDRDHEIMQGFEPFETWDETYVHTAGARSRKILMERVEGDHREPWTWTNSYGKGRIFYTASGHDERTWSHPGFHDLLHRGLLWAMGPAKKAALEALHLPELTYADAKIPNYEKRDPPPRLQSPLSPEQSMQHIQVPPGFTLQLFASEPDIINPISLNWDEKGRLWVLETVDYPNMIQREDGLGRDRIKILEDTDGDGKADSFTVFAEDLSVPTSLVFSDGGVIVAQAPQVIFLRDNDGDDVADERKVLMDGWGSYDTHATLSNLRYGPDNRIWGVVGYSGFDGEVDGKALKFRQGIIRFNTDGSGLEYLSKTSNNTWGLGFSETFDVFISTANNTHSGYMGIPHDHLQDAEGLTFSGVQKIDGHYHFHPITENFRQVDVFGGFTAAAGHSFYNARDFPQDYWNTVALVCEPTGHLLHRAIIEKDGAGFSESDGWNLLASHDEWVSPVCAEVGPDGAVWIADWYNFIIQHNPTPEGFENGEGNAHINPLRDKQHGRIYRLSYNEAEHNVPELDPANTDQLLSLLGHANQFWRLQAQRLLVESGNPDIVSKLREMLRDEAEDKLGLNPRALHALWTLQGLSGFAGSDSLSLEAGYSALSHPVAGIRKSAIWALPTTGRTTVEMLASNVFFDRDRHVRLAAINKAYDLPAGYDLAETLADLAADDEVGSDLWLARATYLAAVKHRESFVQAILKDDPQYLERSVASAPEEKPDYKNPDLEDSSWYDIPAPAWWGNHDIKALVGFDGLAWYRRSFELTPSQAEQRSTLYLAHVADDDITYVNGVRVGQTKGWNADRIYRIPKGVLRPGKNVIATQIHDLGGGGGLWGEPHELYLQVGGEQVPLDGIWKLAIEKVVASAVSPFETGSTIKSLFLENYGPYARQRAGELEETRALIDRTITLRTVRDQMQYDQARITATAGEVIEFVFVNDDAMQHNLLFLEPGSLHEVGEAAEALAKTPNAAELGYRPNRPEILAGTPLVDPGTSHTLVFRVPDQAGDYPYVCTFPGHYKTMNGVLVVKGAEVK